MTEITRREAIQLLSTAAALLAGGRERSLRAAENPPTLPRLKDIFRGRPLIGTTIDSSFRDSYSPAERALLCEQFDVLTPSNALKWQSVQAAEGEFRFDTADAIAAFAEAEGKKLIGHNLVWNRPESTPDWVFRDGARSASAETVMRRLRAHIQAMVGRYRGRICAWDVVNEPIDDGKAFLRETNWMKIVGPDFIAKALQFAHEADPTVRLLINDYGVEGPEKRAKLLRLIGQLRDQNIPLDAVGVQGHYELDKIPYEGLEQTIEAIHAAGCKVAVTELDLDVVPRQKFWADHGKRREELKKQDLYAQGCPAEILQRQAEQYAKLFRILARHVDKIERVTFWGLSDKESWLNDWPWKRTNYPLLFDRGAAPKPAFYAVVDAVRAAE